MRIRLPLTLFVISAGTLLAGVPSPVLPFPEKKIDLLPPLSLAEIGKQKTFTDLNDEAPRFSYRTAPRVESSSKSLSQMPILVPKDDVKWHLRVFAPDSSVDYKLIVKDPNSKPDK